jgi:MFS superfamily sulfate permease-like transporter
MVAPGGINLLPGCVGGTPGGGSINTTRAAFAPGARTRGANLAHALSLAAILLFVRDAIAAIPLAVMARTVIASGE